MEPIKVGNIDVIATADLYRTGSQTYTEFWLSPEERRCIVTQQMRSGGTPEAEWHRRELTATLDGDEYGNIEPPDADALREYLEGSEGQALLGRICAGHEIEWDGHNMVGTMNADARAAWDSLMLGFAALPRSEWHTWEPDEYLDNLTLAELEIPLDATNEQIEAAAKKIETEAKSDYIIIDGDVAEYLKERLEQEKETV